MEEQHKLNHCIIDLSKQYNIKLISTVDSHYARPDLWKERELYKRLGWLGKSNRPDWLSDELPESVDDIGYELYPKNGDQVYDSFVKYSEESGFGGFGYDPQDVIESIENTYEIAHSEIEDFDPDATVRLPSFVVPIGKTEDQALKDMCMEGLRERGIYQRGKYKERILTELEVISARGFSKYFLAMKAISDKAQENYLCSPGRGSAAGSLISYALGITQVDSIKWELLFSRFLRKDATDYPDIDFDVSEPMLLKEQLIQEWGDNVVVPISNWNTLQLRSLIKDISKFYNIPFAEVNSVTRVMIDEATPKAKAERGIKSGMYTPNFEELMKYSKSLSKFFEEYPHVKTYVQKLHGEVRSCSRHAGGVVVGEDLDKHMPLIYNGGVRQTPWSEGQNVRHLEPLGFIKFDILGLASVKMIENCIKNILIRKGLKVPTFRDVKSFYDKNLHPDRMNLKDYDVYENIFHEGNWAGCFQFTEEGAQKFCQEVKPTSIIDISVVTSIYRPGPLGAGVHQQYVDAKNGMKHVEYIHPIHKKITQDTFGFLIFQEQIALLAHQLGDNISLDEGNKLRKLLTKKGGGKGEAEKQKIYKKFIKGCTDKRIPAREAEGLWSKFEYFSGYGFNKSHAVSYSLLSYQCAYLYHYYPVEWMAAFLDKEPESRKEKTVSIAKGAGFDIKPVDINESGKDWGIKGDKVLVQPLSAIKGLGDKAIEQILLNRPFGSVEELIFNEEIKYNKLNKRSLDVLCRSGALKGLEDSRFHGGKHFWSSVAVDRPKSLKKFLENIEKYEHEGEFSRVEKIEYMVGLTGMYPFAMVISDGVIEALRQRDIPPLSEYNKEVHEMAWVIPRNKIVKETKKGNPYWILECIDLGGKTKINCWGVDEKKDSVILNQPHLIKINHDDWGFSTKSISKNFRILS